MADSSNHSPELLARLQQLQQQLAELQAQVSRGQAGCTQGSEEMQEDQEEEDQGSGWHNALTPSSLLPSHPFALFLSSLLQKLPALDLIRETE